MVGKLFSNSNVINTLVSQLLQLPTPSTSTVLEPTDTPSSDETGNLSLGTLMIILIVEVVLLSTLILAIVGVLFLLAKRR